MASEFKLVQVDAALHNLLKWAALQLDKPMKACVGEAISGWLTKQKLPKARKGKGAK